MESHSRYSSVSVSLNISVFVYLHHNFKNAYYSSFFLMFNWSKGIQLGGARTRAWSQVWAHSSFPWLCTYGFCRPCDRNKVRKWGSLWLGSTLSVMLRNLYFTPWDVSSPQQCGTAGVRSTANCKFVTKKKKRTNSSFHYCACCQNPGCGEVWLHLWVWELGLRCWYL